MKLNDPDQTFVYVHPSERELPEEEQTQFKHRAMSWRDKCTWFEEALERQDEAQNEPRQLERRITAHQAYELAAKYLTEVRHIERADGSREHIFEMPSDRDARDRFASTLPIDVAYGICSSIMNASIVQPSDVGKS